MYPHFPVMSGNKKVSQFYLRFVIIYSPEYRSMLHMLANVTISGDCQDSQYRQLDSQFKTDISNISPRDRKLWALVGPCVFVIAFVLS